MFDLLVHKLNLKVLNNVDAGSNVMSVHVDIQGFSLFCAQFSWSGFSAVNPVITLYGSNSLDEPFIPIDSFIPSGTTGGRLVNVEKAGYSYVKVGYSTDSGSGNITASINGKVL